MTVSAQQHTVKDPKACRCSDHLIPLSLLFLFFFFLFLFFFPPFSFSHTHAFVFSFFFLSRFSLCSSRLRSRPALGPGRPLIPSTKRHSGSSTIYRLSPRARALRIYFPPSEPRLQITFSSMEVLMNSSEAQPERVIYNRRLLKLRDVGTKA